MEELMKDLIKFQSERDWKQFHTPENLAKSISIEAAELLEHFQWNKDYDKLKKLLKSIRLANQKVFQLNMINFKFPRVKQVGIFKKSYKLIKHIVI